MNIKFTSSLTPEDENAIAPALLAAVTHLLDLLPIAYVIRIDTSDSQVFLHTGSGRQESDPRGVAANEPRRLEGGGVSLRHATLGAR